MNQTMPGSVIFWRVILIGLCASLLSNLFLMVTAPIDNFFPFIPRYSLFQYLFSYQDLGFVRRAFIGSFLDLPNDAGFVWQVYLFATGQFAALLIALAYWVSRHGDPGFAWIVILSPATFLQLGYDFARFDALFVLLTGFCLMSRSQWPILLVPVMVLIHEGTIVMFAPLIVLAHVYRFGVTPLLAVSVVLASGLVIWFALNTQILATPIYETYTLLPKFADILRRSFDEHRVFVAGHYAETWFLMRAVPFFFFVHVVAAIYIVAIVVFVGRGMAPGLWRVLLLMACCMPLMLIPIGIDLGRWGAMTVFNLFLLHLAWAQWSPPETRPATVIPSLRFAILWVLFLFGPFAFGRPFPFARSAFTYLHQLPG